MFQANSKQAQIIEDTLAREMHLQLIYGSGILERYGITGDIDQVNAEHVQRVQAFTEEWGN